MLDEKSALQMKIHLLSEGINFEMDLFEEYPKKFYDNQFVYGQTSKNSCSKNRFPQVILLAQNVNCALLRRERSSYRLEQEGTEFILSHNGYRVTTIGLPERPIYFDQKLSDGTAVENILAVAGEATPGFFLHPTCYYFDIGKPCSFCSMKGTRQTVGKHMAIAFSKQQISECIHIVENTPWRPVPIYSVTTGTCEKDENFIENVITPLQYMYDSMQVKTKIHLLTHPPKDLDVLYQLKEAGVSSIAFNLEVFNQQAMNDNCPGKFEKYGYKEWWTALKKARDIWGEYHVYCGLVWGLEDPKDTIRGNQVIADSGIAVASNIFHADPRSRLAKHPHPSVEDISRIATSLAKLYHIYPKMNTIFDVSMRSTIDWEIKQGFLE